MEDPIVGVLAIAAGAVLCGRGYLALRLLIPVWGAYAGFMTGAGIVAAVTDEPVLAAALGWPLALLLAVLFALLAYLSFELSIIISMAAIGFALGTALMVALGVRWSWVVILVALAVAALLAALAIVVDLPSIVLVAVTATAGAAAVVFGVMLVIGHIELVDLTSDRLTAQLHDDRWWYLLYVVVALAGATAQLASRRRVDDTLRSRWDDQRHLPVAR